MAGRWKGSGASVVMIAATRYEGTKACASDVAQSGMLQLQTAKKAMVAWA